MTPLDRELLVSSVCPDGQMSLPAGGIHGGLGARVGDGALLRRELGLRRPVGGPARPRRPEGGRPRARGALLVRGEDGSCTPFTTCAATAATTSWRSAERERKVRPLPLPRVGLRARRGAQGDAGVRRKSSGSTRPTTRSCRSVSPSGMGGSSSTPAGTPRLSRSTSEISGR